MVLIYAKYLYKSCHYLYLCHSNHRDYNGGKYPWRISLLDRFESNLGKTSRWAKSLKIHENLPDVTVDIIVGGQLSINRTGPFLNSGTEPFNCEEEGKTLLSVILWDLGINICHIFKIGGPWKFLANWHQTWATLPKSQNFTMKGTMQLVTSLIYMVVVHCFKVLSPWDYPWSFGFLL